MSKLNYNTTTLIECIEKRPCIWDQFIDGYKDTLRKRQAWNQVFKCLAKDFRRSDRKTQKKIGDSIKSKWHNVRDAFVRSLRRESDLGFGRKYIYYDKLKFLLKVVQRDDIAFNAEEKEIERKELSSQVVQKDENAYNTEEKEIEREECLLKVVQNDKNAYNTEDKEIEQEEFSLKVVQHDEITCITEDIEIKQEDDTIFIDEPDTPISCLNSERIRHDPDERETTQDLPTLDEDDAFFISLLPSIKRLSEDEKLEFRMGVLQVLQKVKRKRNEFTIEYVKSSI